MSDTNDSPMNAWRRLRQEKRDGKPKRKKEPVYTDKEVDTGPKRTRITLEKIPYANEDHKKAAQIAGGKILRLIDILKIHYKDVTENGYFTTDKKDQKEYMLGLEALIRTMKPTVDNKHIQGDWRDIFEPITERLRRENHWSEDPEFVREHRYQVFGNGTIENRYKYTKAHILGGSIIPKINDVIFISDNFLFLKAFFKNHFETKYQMLMKREKDEKERIG